jgi:hypothetical protein
MAQVAQNLTLAGLTSVTTSAPTAGVYQILGKISVPYIPGGSTATSSVVATIQQNNSTIYTGPAGAEGFAWAASCAAGDTLSVALTSSTAVDQGTNVIKAAISIG